MKRNSFQEVLPDMPLKSKLLFFATTFIFLALAAVPSLVLVETTQQYCRFLSGWEPGVLRSTKTKRLPYHSLAPNEPTASHIHFVEFKFRAPKAKKVFLAGDFNQWKPETMPLAKKSDGQWLIQVPLPPGKYSYLFQVDGTWAQDPVGPSAGSHNNIPASVMEVKP